MRALALLSSAGVAALLLALLELTRLPTDVLGASALAGLVRAGLNSFSGALLLVAVAAAALASFDRYGDRASLSALALSGAAQGALAWTAAAEHPSLTWHPAVFVVFGLGALALAALHLGLARAHVPWLIGAGLVLAGGLVARLHYGVLVGSYLPAHAAALQLAFVALTLGFALLASKLRRVGWLGAATVLAVVIFASADAPSVAGARPYLAAYTELGRGAAARRARQDDGPALWPTALPDEASRAGRFAPASDGAALFAAHSGLPALPPGFSLEGRDVLLVLSDATRADRSAALPNLEALAARGQRFGRAYSPSNGTFPSLASMLAMVPVSLAELDVRPRFWRGRLRAERETAPEAMQAAGRATFWVGHDHRGCFSTHLLGLEQGFDERTLVHQERGRDADADARIADAAIEAIERRRASGERYFGLVFFVSPHDDYQAHGSTSAGASELERYDAELAFMDAQLGRLLEAVDDGTVVIFSGDHGEAFGEHGGRHHLTSLHDEEIHVPLVVRVPGLEPAEHAAPVSTAYVLPWLLAAGAPEERALVEAALRDDVGPMMRALDGAVLSEMIGPSAQRAALIDAQHVALYDVFADLTRIYSADDALQRDDLRETDPSLLARLSQRARRYREARFAARRFRFTAPDRPRQGTPTP